MLDNGGGTVDCLPWRTAAGTGAAAAAGTAGAAGGGNGRAGGAAAQQLMQKSRAATMVTRLVGLLHWVA